MTFRALLPALLLLLGVAGPVNEVEPDAFGTPQSVGTLGAAGIQITGSISPTSPNGLSPGDDDGFTFTMGADGAVTATVDDGDGTPFVLALSRAGPPEGSLLGAVIGPGPLTLCIPGLTGGSDYRIGVTALGGGASVNYALDLDPVNTLPRWSGADCGTPAADAEPDDTTAAAVDLGDYTGLLCGSGSLSSIVPPESEGGGVGDVDTFRFRNILPIATRLVFHADPGTLQVEFQQLVFVGPFPVQSASFGEIGEMTLPVLQPGAEYLIQIHADVGTAPLAYSFFLEPASPVPPPDPEPVEIERAALRFPKSAGKGSFDLQGTFEPGLGAGVSSGASFSYTVRGVGEVFAAGLLVKNDRGRLRYKAPPGAAGLRSLVIDPELATLRMKGRHVDWEDAGDPSDPTVSLDVIVGNVRWGGSTDGVAKGRVLKVK